MKKVKDKILNILLIALAIISFALILWAAASDNSTNGYYRADPQDYNNDGLYYEWVEY